MKRAGKKRNKKISNPLKPTANDLFEQTASKSQLQQVRIIEAAITSFATKGIAGTTYSSLALDCGISRPLIHHYFATLEDLFLLTAKYVRQTLLNLALEEMGKVDANPRAQLEAYLKGCFRWVNEFPAQFSLWLLYFYQASLKGLARTEHSQLVQDGHKRITTLLEAGQRLKEWKIENAEEAAKMIQVLITGSLVSVMTEDGYLTSKKAEELLMKTVLVDLLGAR